MLPQSLAKDLPFAVLGFAARSGTGKTTLLKRLIPVLKQRGLRLGLIKHTHHRITFDNRGLTKKVFNDGVDVIAKSPTLSMAEWHQQNPDTALSDAIECYRHLPIDLLLIEGFKAAPFAKIELHRQSLNQPLLSTDDPQIIAIASDSEQRLNHLPQLDLNDVEGIATWIIEQRLGTMSQ